MPTQAQQAVRNQKPQKPPQKRKPRKKEKKEFSKTLLIQESILIWIMTLSFIRLAYICVANQYFGELPWLSAMVALPWTAYGVSQAFYYNKAKNENTKDGITYETVMAELNSPNPDAMG